MVGQIHRRRLFSLFAALIFLIFSLSTGFIGTSVKTGSPAENGGGAPVQQSLTLIMRSFVDFQEAEGTAIRYTFRTGPQAKHLSFFNNLLGMVLAAAAFVLFFLGIAGAFFSKRLDFLKIIHYLHAQDGMV